VRVLRLAAHWLLIVYLGATMTAAEPRPPVDVRALLKEIGGFTDQDLGQIDRGVAIARVLETDTREIAVAGAVRIRAQRDRLVARVRDIDHLKRSAVVLDAGRFHEVPIAEDLARAPFEEYNLDLRDCRPGECRVRLSADDITRFHQTVDWRATDWRDRSTRTWREVLAAHAAAYARDGRAALPVYTNKAESLSVASELLVLSAKFGFASRFSTDLHRYLQQFGRARPACAEETMYWSKEDFGVRPVLRISHQIICPAHDAVLIATNQVYADHYLDAALGLTIAVDAGDAAGDAFYMIAVNRARTRSLSGFLRRMLRGTVQGRSRDAMRKILTGTRAGLESDLPH
jgi:hypothetical protein